jgi:hypothetical protein
MIKDSVPFLLGEAQVALYYADANGQAILTAPIWFGVEAQDCSMLESRESFFQASTGARGYTEYQGNSIHRIEIGRAWALPAQSGVDRTIMREFMPARNQRFVMQFAWQDRETQLTHQRIYFNVVFQAQDLRSRRALDFNQRQRCSAEWMEENAC